MTLITLIFADQKERILPQINADTRGSKIAEIAKPITTKDTKEHKGTCISSNLSLPVPRCLCVSQVLISLLVFLSIV